MPRRRRSLIKNAKEAANAALPFSKKLKQLPRSRARAKADGAIVRPVFTRADLINAESAIGRTIFGPIPAGHSREFFEQSKNVWIWHESWLENGKERSTTMRYEVRPEGVFKKLQGSEQNYLPLSDSELKNFRDALHRYLELVKTELY